MNRKRRALIAACPTLLLLIALPVGGTYQNMEPTSTTKISAAALR